MTAAPDGFVRANGLRFAYRQWGSHGPLALLLHGFPDSPGTWRHLGPALRDAGYRAVAPWMRGYAPSQLPAGSTTTIRDLAGDADGLHAAFGGDERAVLIGHDWGALATLRAAASGRWRRAVAFTMPLECTIHRERPPLGQARKSWYIGRFLLPGAARHVRRNDAALLERLWRAWSPNYEPSADDLDAVRDALLPAGHAEAAVGYYRGLAGSIVTGRAFRPGSPAPVVPALVVVGSDDGCFDGRLTTNVLSGLPDGSERAELAGGHFVHLEQPAAAARLVLGFLAPA